MWASAVMSMQLPPQQRTLPEEPQGTLSGSAQAPPLPPVLPPFPLVPVPPAVLPPLVVLPLPLPLLPVPPVALPPLVVLPLPLLVLPLCPPSLPGAGAGDEQPRAASNASGAITERLMVSSSGGAAKTAATAFVAVSNRTIQRRRRGGLLDRPIAFPERLRYTRRTVAEGSRSNAGAVPPL